MEIKAAPTYSKEACRTWFYSLVYKKTNPKRILIKWNVLFSILILILIAELAAFGRNILLIITLSVAVLFLILLDGLSFIGARIFYSKTREMQGSAGYFIFRDTGVTMTADDPDLKGTITAAYSMFKKAIETPKYLFLCIKDSIFIVDKAAIENGTIDEIRQCITSVSGLKYTFYE